MFALSSTMNIFNLSKTTRNIFIIFKCSFIIIRCICIYKMYIYIYIIQYNTGWAKNIFENTFYLLILSHRIEGWLYQFNVALYLYILTFIIVVSFGFQEGIVKILRLCVKSKLQELRGHKVVPIMSYIIDLSPWIIHSDDEWQIKIHYWKPFNL